MAMHSLTVLMKPFTYVFLNETNSDRLLYIRWDKEYEDAERGEVGIGSDYVPIQAGPIAYIFDAVTDKTNKWIKIYYFDKAHMINEIKLEHADDKSTKPGSGWVKDYDF